MPYDEGENRSFNKEVSQFCELHMLHEEIKGELKEAMKAHDDAKLRTVRSMLTAFTNELVATGKKPQDMLDDAGVLTVIKRLAKHFGLSVTAAKKKFTYRFLTKDADEPGEGGDIVEPLRERVLGRAAAPARVAAAVQESFLILSEYARRHVLLCLVPAFFVAGALSALVPQSSVVRFLGPGASRWVAYPAAVGAGSLLAVCSCTVQPLFAGIYRQGAGLGPAITFLFFAPAANILALSYTGVALGAEFAVARVLLSLVFGVGIGMIMAALFHREELARAPVAAAVTGGEGITRRTALFLAVLVALLIGGTLKAYEEIHVAVLGGEGCRTELHIVDKLAEEAREKLVQAGYRGHAPYVAFLFFRMVTPVALFLFDRSPAWASLMAPLAATYVMQVPPRRYRHFAFRVGPADVRVAHGWLWRTESVVLHSRIQHVDTRQGPVARMMGLGTVVVFTAGSVGAMVGIPALAEREAEALRDRLAHLSGTEDAL